MCLIAQFPFSCGMRICVLLVKVPRLLRVISICQHAGCGLASVEIYMDSYSSHVRTMTGNVPHALQQASSMGVRTACEGGLGCCVAGSIASPTSCRSGQC